MPFSDKINKKCIFNQPTILNVNTIIINVKKAGIKI